MKPIDYLVEVQNLEIRRGNRVILKDVDFSMVEGEFCYLCGPTGSGKSTFLKALYGAVLIYAGHVRVLDHDVRRLTSDQMPYYRRSLGVLFQELMLIDEWTVLENLDFVLRATDWKDSAKRTTRIHEVLEQVGMLSYLNATINTLSGGEKLLVAMARSVLNKPRLLLADEPTGSLDTKASVRVMGVLLKLAKQYRTSVIMCTHDQSLLERYPARSFQCEDQEIREIGISRVFNR